MKTIKMCLTVLVAALVAGACFAQSEAAKPAEPPPPKYFRLDFVVKELDSGKVVNSRAYSMTISTGPQNTGPQNRVSSIRAGSRVPVSTKSGEYTYLDVGVNIDCNSAKEVQNQLALNVIADVSTTANDTSTGPAGLGGSTNTPGQPIIRQNRWSGDVLVPLRKATTIFSSDDATTKRQMQLELTATPIP
jgi:hypothetical protein